MSKVSDEGGQCCAVAYNTADPTPCMIWGVTACMVVDWAAHLLAVAGACPMIHAEPFCGLCCMQVT